MEPTKFPFVTAPVYSVIQEEFEDSDNETNPEYDELFKSPESMLQFMTLKSFSQWDPQRINQQELSKQNEWNRINQMRQNPKQNIHSNEIFVLKIYLTGIKPRIKRTISIPSKLSLAIFHDKILTPLFNWKRNFHA
eukprot:33879_1